MEKIIKIGINALGPVSSDTGGRTYLINLSRNLAPLLENEEIFFFVSPGESTILHTANDRYRLIEIDKSLSTVQRIRREHFSLPGLIKKHDIDVMYYPGNFASWKCPVPYVLAIRSMLVYNRPDDSSVSRIKKAYRRYLLPRSARNAANIITPSEHTKREIIDFLKADEQKIHAIPHGIDVSLFSQPKNDSAAQLVFPSHHVQKPFILYVSALWEYKNHDKLILAFRDLLQMHHLPHQLVLVGQGMNSFEGYAHLIKRLITDSRLDDRVRMIGFLPHEELVHLYQNADVFAFPSLTESFGNPLFEAMAAGTPVISSNTHAMTDLTGNAALHVNPNDTDEFSRSLYRLITDETLRNTFIQKGREKVNNMSWTQCARQTLNIIKQSIHTNHEA